MFGRIALVLSKVNGDKVVRFMLSGNLFHETVHTDGGFLELVEVVYL